MKIKNLLFGLIITFSIQAFSQSDSSEKKEFIDSLDEMDLDDEYEKEADEFARKFLWAIDGQLQGQHHIDDLRLYMRNHYIPKHLIDEIYNMLLAQANSPARFKGECSSCHNSAEEFIRRAIFIKAGELTGVESGIPVLEFLKTHQGLQHADVEFFTILLTRVLNDIYRS